MSKTTYTTITLARTVKASTATKITNALVAMNALTEVGTEDNKVWTVASNATPFLFEAMSAIEGCTSVKIVSSADVTV